MEFDAWYANYLEDNMALIEKQEFTLSQLNLIYKLLKAAFEADKSANNHIEPTPKTLSDSC